MTYAIELRDVHAGYGRIEVLHGVDLAVPVGTVYALLGPNGAGKSTTLSVIAGNVTPKSGCVHVAGAHVNGARPDALVRAGVSRIPEGRGIFPNLTVDDNLRMWTYAASAPLAEVQETDQNAAPGGLGVGCTRHPDWPPAAGGWWRSRAPEVDRAHGREGFVGSGAREPGAVRAAEAALCPPPECSVRPMSAENAAIRTAMRIACPRRPHRGARPLTLSRSPV